MTSSKDPTFRNLAPAGWQFHRHSSRWTFNLLHPGADEVPEAGSEYPSAPFLQLPDPAPLTATLQALVERRASCRSFRDTPIFATHLASVLKHSVGALGTKLFGNMELIQRPCPSPGGLYPLEVYVIARRVDEVEAGIYHYHPQTHGLALIRDALPPKALDTYLFMGQPYAAAAAATLVLTFVPARSLKKYADRGYRYALIEAGHIGQNIVLASEALDLGCCPLGGFLDVELGQLLSLNADREYPLYAFALGEREEAEHA